MLDPGTTDPGTAELQLGIVMADPGNAYQHLSGGPSSYAQTGAVRS